ncbi:uncharacterized protein LOC117899174 [Drosophila subobscura]|uniref:uncharacterized protein LOC117899174 n=1 Tax=Drosophila subobscura TaxID=7241 RepID=UPI00155B1567|nr:uncharacterized protein LOC117899174 [Drosophila subobscura]
MKLTRIGWLLAFVSLQRAIVSIRHIKVFGESRYMRVKTHIHEDRTHFDLNVRLVRELGSNHLVMNVKVRVKPDGKDKFVRLFELKRINFCGFLSEYNASPMLRLLFKKSVILSDIIECPIRVGNYSMLNADVAENISPDGVQNGTYNFFTEIVEESGEIAKVFAMQVTSTVQIIEPEPEPENGE